MTRETTPEEEEGQEGAGAPRPPARPCASGPYRCDVPSGIWAAQKYDKLAGYDGPTWTQSRELFLCHQRDGHPCSGWLACHGARDLLALRLHPADPSAKHYFTDVLVFGSGREALAQPGAAAERMIRSLLSKRRAYILRSG